MFVADASTTLAWMLPQQMTAVSERAFRLVAKSPVVVPAIWQLEVQNVVLKLVRQRKLLAEDGEQVRMELMLLSKRVDGALDGDAFDRVWAIATGQMMTAYDASYVELALRLSLPLASDDMAIRTAAKNLGVKLV